MGPLRVMSHRIFGLPRQRLDKLNFKAAIVEFKLQWLRVSGEWTSFLECFSRPFRLFENAVSTPLLKYNDFMMRHIFFRRITVVLIMPFSRFANLDCRDPFGSMQLPQNTPFVGCLFFIVLHSSVPIVHRTTFSSRPSMFFCGGKY